METYSWRGARRPSSHRVRQHVELEGRVRVHEPVELVEQVPVEPLSAEPGRVELELVLPELPREQWPVLGVRGVQLQTVHWRLGEVYESPAGSVCETSASDDDVSESVGVCE